MPVVGYPMGIAADKASWPKTREWAADLVDTIGNGKEPGLAFWDVTNEPGKARIEFARYMAGVFRELDKVTPITIGSTVESEMEATGSDLVDVLCSPRFWSRASGVRRSWTQPPPRFHKVAGSVPSIHISPARAEGAIRVAASRNGASRDLPI